MAANLIEFQNVSYVYTRGAGNKLEALKNINFDIAEGEFVAVLGHNGSGKSTLAKHVNALLVPTKGQVLIGGLDSRDEKSIWDIRKSIGMVFQNPDNQLVATTVEEDIAFGPENMGIPSKEIRTRVDEGIKTVGMEEYRLHSPHQLSGGQKQRVAIAGMIAMRPKCIVFDEPTAMLDPVGRQEVMTTIKRLNQEDGITILHITHFMDEAIMADRVIVMDSGEIALGGTPREIFSNIDLLYKLHLDVPQVTALANSLYQDGYQIPRDILTVDEMVKFLCQ